MNSIKLSKLKVVLLSVLRGAVVVLPRGHSAIDNAIRIEENRNPKQ